MATITWTGNFGVWTTSTNWSPSGVPDSSSDTATIDAGAAELFSAAETVGVLDIGPVGSLLIDYFTGQSGGSLTVTGTLTNDGGPVGQQHGLAIGNSTGGSTTVTLGALDNATTSSAIGIQNAVVTVLGNATNNGTDSSAGIAGIGIGFQPGELAATVTVDGSFTNSGFLGVGSASTLTIDGTLTNSGSAGSTPATSNGVFIGNVAESLTATATVGAIDNTATGAMSIQDSKLTVTGNVSNAGTGSDGGFDLEDGASVTVDGNFTNIGKLGLDYFIPGDAGSTLTIDGTLTNSGGGTSNGMGIFNAASVVDVSTLNNSGTVFGIGTIEGDVNNTGTLFGGLPISGVQGNGAQTPGTLTITGNYTQSATGTLVEAVAGTDDTGGTADPTDTWSTLKVSGAVDLQGGALPVSSNASSDDIALGNSFTVMTFTPGELTGTFSSLDGVAGQAFTNIGHGLGLWLDYDNAGGNITVNVANAGVTDTWTGGSGNWSTGTWSPRTPGGVDDADDTAVINHGGSVSITNTSTVGSVANVTIGAYSGSSSAGQLVLADGQLTVLDNLTNNGSLGVDPGGGFSGSSLVVYGTLTNNADPNTHGGMLIGNSSGGGTEVQLGTLDNTSTGGMDIDNATVTVTGNVTNNGTNSSSGIAGIGIGFIPGELAATVTVDGSFTNGGFLGVGSASTLTIDGTLTNSGSAGSTPAISNGVFIGNAAEGLKATATVTTIDNAATGAMSIQDSKLTVTGSVTNNGTGSDAGFDLEDGASVTVDGNFTNTGKLGLDYFIPGDAGSTLTIDGTLTNNGGGTSNGMGIFNAASVVDVKTLNNSGNLFGIGTIEGDLNNTGTVFGGGAPTSGTLTITAKTTNSGTLEATAGGGLDIESNVTNTKTIEALGTNTRVVIDGVTITNTGGLVLASGTNAKVNLEFDATIAGGTVEAFGTGANVDLDNATISGGKLETSGAGAAIEATSTGSYITNAAIAAGSLVVVEDLAALTLSGGTIGSGAMVEALSGGVLIVTGTIASAGTLFADGTFVFLNSGTVTGGTLKTAGTGVIEDNSNSVLSGVTIAAGSTVEVNGSYLNLAGAIANAGTIDLTTTSSGANLVIKGTVTLSGGGKVTLSNSSANQILSNGYPATLTNLNNTIAGAGTIGDVVDGNLKLVNAGTFDANAAKSLALATGTSTITNSGTLEATASGSLEIDSNVANSKTIAAVGADVLLDGVTITNTATGVVFASAGAFVDLENTTISGGTLATTTGATFLTTTAGDVIKNATIAALVEVQGTTSLTISGGTIDAGAVVETLSDGVVVVTGTVASAGTLFASGAGSWVHINGTVTGGTAEVGNGIVEIAGASSENVSFLSTGSGGLELDGLNKSYTGKISGFGGVAHGNTGQYIDFTGVSYTGESFTYTPANGANTSGTLTVTDGTHSASVTLVGQYVKGNFKAEDINGTLAITDPINSGAGGGTGGTLSVGDGVHSANVALLGNYMASSFVTAADGHGGTLITEASQTSAQPELAHPHAG
jgi:hypothetical protein